MYKDLISYLKSYKKSTIKLGELENLVSGDITYNEFAKSIKRLVNENILIQKNPNNNNGKEISLPYKFGINRYELRKEHVNKIQKYELKISKEIDLQEYFNLNENMWNKDLPYIEKINDYINKKGFPRNYTTAQERSFNIVGDEKWIDEKGGRKILERIKIWEKLNIVNNSDPLMLAINPKKLKTSSKQLLKITYYHLIVENKATFLELLDVLKDTKFTSLIWGSGWKIVANITMLEKQLGVQGEHKIYYFGDLDNEGISIWNSLNEKVNAFLAVEFYRKLINKNYSLGKETQIEDYNALKNFFEFFSDKENEKIKNILNKGGYLPQEALNKNELRDIWRNTNWI
ncbi:hypothetical protein CLOACE_13950 [Clostridium acetireducens DSM 10703]|uniref:Wadjet protein JetD C-terminal domain-containing protein n=1 Tax=Clostridium acetireducens DSM 10703 TaxID=1121290 RepID=A0A1E8EYH8_9CLOT|nr:Wadjet anti-phage system protein JetD domain-containing protein [Clostridium acetireducens]OFI06014.1 hypothetical protein CLOACE_13950 [Clostridium acetireducens DSM 10703]